MKWIESARYVLALMLWITLPPAVVYWLIVHSWAGFWRRLGPAKTFAALFVVLAGVGYVAWLWREPGLAVRYPFRPWLVPVGLGLYALAAVIEHRCRKHLKLRILVGVPELSADDPGQLLTEGIYAHVRNPRYLDLIVGLAGWSLIINYQGLYWMILGLIVGLYVVVRLEERELEARFGAPYLEYCRSVPRFLPRSWAFLRT